MSFFHSPRSSKPRQWIFELHLYSGLAIGLLALVVGLSGAALVYAPEFEMGAPAGPGPRLPLPVLAAKILDNYPGYALRGVRFDAQQNATEFHVHARTATPGKAADLHLAVDPASGAVQREVNRKAGFWHWMRELHHNLLAGKAGRIGNGIGAALLLFLCLSGIVIWWPGPKLWRKRLTIASGTGWKRWNWDLHNALGFWMAGALAFFSFTGVYFAFPHAVQDAVRYLTASPRPLQKHDIPLPQASRLDAAPLDALLRAARRAVPGARIAQLKLPHGPLEPVEVRLKTPFDLHRDGNNKVFLDPRTAAVLHVQRFSALSAGNRFLAVIEPLHMARFMSPGLDSLLLRSFWIAAGLAPGILFLSGFFMWWNRVARKRMATMPALRPVPLRRLARGAAAALILLAAGWRAAAQQPALEGRVADGSGGAIADAKVTVHATPERTVRTDGQGRFFVSNLPPSSYAVTVEAPGFEALRVRIQTGVAADLVLVPAVLVETVVVNAGTFDQMRLDEATFQTGLTRDDIATRNNRRLSDVVARMPGVFLSGPPGGDKDVRMRGLDKEFSRTQVDGIVIPDGGEKRELQLNRIPSATVESVRIVRNPTAEFESDGLAGRVDVQTRPIPDRFHLDARAGHGARNQSFRNPITQGQISGGMRFHRNFGFFGTFDSLHDTLPIERNKLLANGDLESESERQDQRSPNFFGDFGIFTQRFGELHLKPVIMNFHSGVGKLRETHNGAHRLAKREEEGEDKNQLTRGLSLNHRFAGSAGLLIDTQAAWFRSSEDKDRWKLAYKVAPDGSYAPDKRTLEPETKADQTWSAASSAAIPLQAAVWHELKFGASLRLRNRFRNKDRFEVSPNGVSRYTGEAKDRYSLEENYAAGFIQDRLRLTDRLSLTPGVRYERVSLHASSGVESAAPRTFLDVNPSGHLLYRLTANVSLRAAVSRGLSRPKFDEISPYENVTATKIVIGNPSLEPARAWNYDAGFDYATRLATFSVNAFRKTIRGVIEEVDTAVDRDGRDVFRVSNVGNGWTRGIELEQRLRMPSSAPRWARLFSFWANQTLLASNLRAFDGQERPFKEQPRWIGNLGADFSDEKFGTSVSLMGNFISRRYDYKSNGDVSATAGSSSLDLALYQRVRGNWRIFVEGNNLSNRYRVLDENFRNGTTNRRTELFGRTMLAGVQVSF